MLIQFSPMKSRKSLAHDVFNTFATHAGHVYDITDTWQNLQLCLHDFPTSIFDKQDQILDEKLLCV